MKTAPKNNRKEGKSRPSLLPFDLYIKYVCPAYEEGVIKYQRESWRDGFWTSDLFDACMRHLNSFFYKGEDFDPDAQDIKKHHLGAAIFCMTSILNTLETRPELDDRPCNKEVVLERSRIEQEGKGLD